MKMINTLAMKCRYIETCEVFRKPRRFILILSVQTNNVYQKITSHSNNPWLDNENAQDNLPRRS